MIREPQTVAGVRGVGEELTDGSIRAWHELADVGVETAVGMVVAVAATISLSG